MGESNYWTNIEILTTGDQYFSELLTAFRHAKKHIEVEVYILNIDSLTRVLLEELMKAAERGVRVQILVDGFGSYGSIQELKSFAQRHKIEFRAYQPLTFLLVSRNIFRFFKNLNRRNHRKLVVIDDNTAFVGSMNWTQVHSRRLMGPKAWRDTAAKVRGPEAAILHLSYRANWSRAAKISLRRFRRKPPLLRSYDPTKSWVRINTGLRDRWKLHRDLLRRIRTAKERICITTAYFLPHGSIVRALKKAARRGISVEILTPGPSDVPIVKWASFELAHVLLRGGVKIFEYRASVLHAKTILIDNWATIGSTNLNYRSFFHDLEVEVVLNDEASLTLLEKQWKLDLTNSKAFSQEDYLRSPWWHRWLARLAFRLRYLM